MMTSRQHVCGYMLTLSICLCFFLKSTIEAASIELHPIIPSKQLNIQYLDKGDCAVLCAAAKKQTIPPTPSVPAENG